MAKRNWLKHRYESYVIEIHSKGAQQQQKTSNPYSWYECLSFKYISICLRYKNGFRFSDCHCHHNNNSLASQRAKIIIS